MNFDQLITSLRKLDHSLKERSIKMVNVGLSARNWLVGAYLVEFEQRGVDRAAYGESLLSNIAKRLKIRGLAVRNLEACRLFYLAYPEIPQSLAAEFAVLLPEIPQPPTAESENGEFLISQALSGKFPPKEKGQSVTGHFKRPEFALPVATLVQKLTFTHFVELLRLDDPLQRAFYEIECVKSGWSVRELKRQIGSLLYERLGLSTDKEKLLRLTAGEVTPAQPADVIKDPYIFEFLGLTPKEAFRENDLETALIDHLSAAWMRTSSSPPTRWPCRNPRSWRPSSSANPGISPNHE